MDYFWKLWWIGIAITIATKIAITYLSWYYFNELEKSKKSTQILMHLLVIICINLVGGIAVAKFLGFLVACGNGFWDCILGAIIPAVLTFIVGFFVLELYRFNRITSLICFIVVFIFSIIGWTIPISQHSIEYYQNIETTTETIVVQDQKRQLLYFCNIPVQEISGSVSGSSSFGFGSVSGKISTSNELTYWYANENGEGKYDSALASNSTIVFIEDGENPYVEIITYRNQTQTINHNNGEESTKINDEWSKYIFYLPEAVMQYPLD